MEHPRYRATENALSIGFLFGALSATELSGPVLISLLGGLGLGESTARNALTRMVGVNALTSRRAGRNSVYHPSEHLLGKFQQVLGTTPEQPWDGVFRCLVYDIPERERRYRDRFRYLAEFNSYGQLRPGVLISPRQHSLQFESVISERPDGTRIHLTELHPGDLRQASRLAHEAWSLPELQRRYQQLTESIEVALTQGLAPATGSPTWLWEQFDRWHQLYRDVIRLQFDDPALPRVLLPADWPEPLYWDRLSQLNLEWGPVLLPELRRFAAERDKAGLCRFEATPYFLQARPTASEQPVQTRGG